MKKTYLLLFLMVMVIGSFAQKSTSETTVIKCSYFDVSPPLRDMVKAASLPADYSWKNGVVMNKENPNKAVYNPFDRDGAVQDWFGSVADTTDQNFAGISSAGFIPPDTDGDVGPNHYFQTINCKYAVFNKTTGAILLGPSNNSTIWSGMPNNSNDGDAVVLYDEAADRWLFTQFSLPHYPNGPFFEMVAISQTPDPTGSWYRYEFQFTDMPDYPKFGVWQDAYYMTCNRFAAGAGNYVGFGAVAMDRAKMLIGDPNATMQLKTLGTSVFGVLPADCDGTLPPAGTPNYMICFKDGSQDNLQVYEFHVDWTTPANSTLTLASTLFTAPFSSSLSSGIPQKGTTRKLDALNDRMMFRLQYRYFSDHWTMVTCHTVNANAGIAGIRWYELRKSGTSPWSIYQQSTFSPDNNYRFCPSIAMDSSGNIALGYNISASDMYPSIRYTGRLAGDPLNEMTINEAGIMNGTGSQTYYDPSRPLGRWGDYSSMSVDPSAPMKFWYTQEYYATTSQMNFVTRIASFSFGNIFMVNPTADPSTVCDGTSSQLDAGAVGGSGNYTYSWTSVPAGFTSTQSSPVVTPSVTTKYVCTVNDGSSSKTDSVKVTVVSPPTAFAGNDTTHCIEFASWPVRGHASNYASLHWTTQGDGHFINDTLLNVTYVPGTNDKATANVTLTLSAISAGDCTPASDDIHVVLTPCTGIDDPGSAIFGLVMTPNPTSGLFALTVNGVKNQEVRISVTTLQGSSVLERKINSARNSMTEKIDLSGYAKGVYVVKVSAGENTTSGKVVVR